MELKHKESNLKSSDNDRQTNLLRDSIEGEGERRVDDDLQAGDHNDGPAAVSNLPENLRHCRAERVLLDRVGWLQEGLSREDKISCFPEFSREAPHIHWFSPGRSMFQSTNTRPDSSLDGAEEEIFEDVGLQDHLESFLSPRFSQSEAKRVNLRWRMENYASLDPLSVWYTARTPPTQGLQFLIENKFNE